MRFVGARSGELDGEVNCTCCSVPSLTTGITWVCQTGFLAGGAPGDSGAPAFRRVGPGFEVELVGLVWGGDGTQMAYSPIGNIESEIGALDVVVQDDPPEIEIVAPVDGSSLGGGGFPIAGLVARGAPGRGMPRPYVQD